MIQFNVNGQYLDLYDKTNLQFVRKNMLYAFDDVQLDRTAQFAVPATPKNNTIFGLANNPAYYGRMARIKIPAQLQAGGVAIDGQIHVISCNTAEYTLLFSYGNLQDLKVLKEAGNVSEYTDLDDSVRVGQDIYTAGAAMEVSPIPLFANVAYRNGHTSKPNPEDIINYTDGYYPLPSIELLGLLESVMSRLGISIDTGSVADLKNIRITLPRPITMAGAGAVVFKVDNNVITNAKPLLFRVGTQFAAYRRNRQIDTWNIAAYIAEYSCSLTFYESFPDDLLAVRVATSNYTLIWQKDRNDSLAGKTVNIERGMVISFVRKDMLPPLAASTNYGIAPADDYSYFGVGMVADDEREAQVGEVIYLRDNLPEITASQLLKLAGVLSSKMPYYEDGTIKFAGGVDSEDIWHLRQVLSIGDVDRSFGKFAQSNVLTFVDESELQLYGIDNTNIEQRNELLKIPFLRGDTTAAYEGEHDTEVLITDIQKNEEDGVFEYLNKNGTLIACEGNIYAVPVEFSPNNYIKSIAEFSTSITAQVLMPLFKFQRLNFMQTFELKGQLYTWTEVQWQNEVAKLNLSKVMYREKVENVLTFTNIGTSVATIWWQGEEPALFPNLFIRKSDEFDFKQWNYATITLAAGESVEMYGDNPNGVSSVNNHFATTGDLELGGHLINFINKNYKDNQDIGTYAFNNLFYQTSIKIVSFILPDNPNIWPLYTPTYRMNDMFRYCTNLYAANFAFAENYVGNARTMLSGCTALKIPPKMPLGTDPRFNPNQSMNDMFNGCTALEVAPEYPATKTSTNNFSGLFANCTSLRVPPPILPITNGGNGALLGMFQNCINLETATKCTSEITQWGMYVRMYNNCPKIKEVEVFFVRRNGTDNTKDAQNMFLNCTSLAKIKVHFKEWITVGDGGVITLDWVKGVSPTGVFICPEELPEIHDDSHIPVGWTVERYTEE